MSDQAKLVSLSDSLVGDTVRSAGAVRAFDDGGEVSGNDDTANYRPLSDEEVAKYGLNPNGPGDDNEDETPELSSSEKWRPLSDEEVAKYGLNPNGPTEYNAPAEAAKRVGKAILPGIAGLAALTPGQVAGQAIGRGLGTLGGGVIGGPPGAIVGGNIGQAIGGVGGQIIGAALTSVAAREAEEWLLDKLGWNTDKEKEAAFQQDYPKSAAASDIAGSMVGMSPAPGAALGTRALMGGVQGAIEAGSEYIHTGEVDPSITAMAIAAGAAAPGLNKVGQAAENLGQRLTGKVRGYVRPDQKPTQATEQPATEQPATEQPATEQPATEQTTPRTQSTDLPPEQAGDLAGTKDTPEAVEVEKTKVTPGGRNLASASLATSHAEPAPAGANTPAPHTTDHGAGFQFEGSERKYNKTAGSNVEPIAKGAEGYPTATVGEPARGNISPEVEHALTGEAVDPNQDASQGGELFTKPLPDEVSHPEPTGIPEAAITDTVTKLRDLGMDQAARHVEENPHLEPQARAVMESPEGLRKFEEARAQKEVRAQEANRLASEGNTKRGGYKLMRDQAEPSAENAARRETEGQVAKVGDETVTAASQVKARLVKRAADAAQSAFDKFATGKIGHIKDQTYSDQVNYTALGNRLREAIAHAKAENTDIHALTPMPRKRTPAQEWLKAAQELVGTPENPKDIRPTKALKFLSDERMLLNGAKAKEVSEFGRIEGDIANNRRRVTGEEAHPQAGADEHFSTESDVDTWIAQTEKELDAERAAWQNEGIKELKPTTEQGETLSDRIARQKAQREAAGVIPEKAKLAGYEDEVEPTTHPASVDTQVKKSIAKTIREAMIHEGGSVNWPDLQKYSGPQRKAYEAALKTIAQKRAPLTLRLWANHVIAQHSDAFFGGRDKNPIRQIHDFIERANVRRREIVKGDEALVEQVAKMSPEFHETMHDESAVQMWGDQPVTQKQPRGGDRAWREAHYPDIAARIKAMTPEELETRALVHKTLKDRETQLAHDSGIRRILKMMKVNDPQLADRILNHTETPADIATHGQDMIDMLRPLGKRMLLSGPYVPLARHGTVAVRATHDIAAPTNGTKLSDTKWGFTTAADRDAFSSKQVNEPTAGTYYIDAKGSSIDPVTGKRYTKENFEDDPTSLTKMYSSDVNDHHLEFLDNEREAIQRVHELNQAGGMSKIDYQKVPWRAKNPASLLASELGFSSDKALARNKFYQKLDPASQAAVREAIAQQHLDLLASTKPMNRALRRQGTSGYNTDLSRSLMEWSHETSQKQALGEYADITDKATEAARKLAEPLTGDPKTSNVRRVLYDEMARRLYDLRSGKDELSRGPFGGFVNRALVYSALDRLATPRFIIQNLTQVSTHTLPYLASEYGGFAAAAKHITQAYKDINPKAVFGNAWADTKEAFAKRKYIPQTLTGLFGRLSDPIERNAMKELIANGSINEESANQMERLVTNPEGVKLNFGRGINPYGDMARRGAEYGLTKLDKGVTYLQDVIRPVNNAAEIINRGVTGLAAFRMEYAKNGGDFEGAVRAATDAIDTTQVRYSDSNKPAWMRNSVARIPLQFKHFGFQQTAILGRSMRQMISGTPAERKKGAIMAGGLLGTTILYAGANGLPFEQIISPVMTALKASGITDNDWNDVQFQFRKTMASVVGPRAAGVISHGLPSLLGLDMTGNLGLNNVLTFGSPDYARVGTRDYYQNVLAWLAQQGGGSVGAMGTDMFKTTNALIHGDPIDASSHMALPRFVSDAIKAGVGFAGGGNKISERGIVKSQPYSVPEATTKALGFSQSRDVDEGEAKHELFVQNKRRSAEISSATAAWLKAKTPEDRAAARQKLIDARGLPSTLGRAQANVAKTNNNNYLGTPITKSSRDAVKDVSSVYPLPPR